MHKSYGYTGIPLVYMNIIYIYIYIYIMISLLHKEYAKFKKCDVINIHAYLHTYIHVYIYTHTHTYIRVTCLYETTHAP